MRAQKKLLYLKLPQTKLTGPVPAPHWPARGSWSASQPRPRQRRTGLRETGVKRPQPGISARPGESGLGAEPSLHAMGLLAAVICQRGDAVMLTSLVMMPSAAQKGGRPERRMLLHSDHLGHQRPEASRFAALRVAGRLAGLAGCVMSVLGWAVKVQKRNSCLGAAPTPAPDFLDPKRPHRPRV